MMLAVEAEYNDKIVLEIYRNPNNEVEGVFFAIKDRVNQGKKINHVIGLDSTFNICHNKFALSVFIAVNPLYNTNMLTLYLMKSESKNHQICIG